MLVHFQLQAMDTVWPTKCLKQFSAMQEFNVCSVLADPAHHDIAMIALALALM